MEVVGPDPPSFRFRLGAFDMGTKNWAGCVIEYWAPPRRRKKPKKRTTAKAPETRAGKRPRTDVESGGDDDAEDRMDMDPPPAAPRIAYDSSGNMVRLDSVGGDDGVIDLVGPDDDPFAEAPDADLMNIDDPYDPEEIADEHIRVLSFIYLDIECNEILGTYEVDKESGKPYYVTALGRHRTVDKKEVDPEMYRTLQHRLGQWTILWDTTHAIDEWAVKRDWTLVPPLPQPPADVSAYPALVEEIQVDHRPGMRQQKASAKAQNGRVASATFTAIAAHDRNKDPAEQHRALGYVSGKAGVPRRKSPGDEEEDKIHKLRAMAFSRILLKKHGQLDAAEYLDDLDRTARQKAKIRGIDVPADVSELSKTESVHSAEALLMAVKKARAIYRKTPLYPALKT